MDDCEADPSCRTEHPRIRSDLAAVLRRLDDGPVSVEIPHPRTAEVQRAEFRRSTFLGTLLGLLQDVGAAPQALGFIRQAAQGDYAALARRAAADHRGFETAMAGGMALSVFCAENPDGAIGPDELAPACAVFPRGDRPPGYREPVRSTVPVLLISGFLDPITPPSGAEAVARHLTASRHVVIRNASHSYTGLSPCVDGIMAAFLETASVEGLDVSCVAGIKRPALVAAERPGR